MKLIRVVTNTTRIFFSGIYYVRLLNFSLRLLLTTETELMAIAAPAIIGLSINPVKGYNNPAATGIAMIL